MGLLDKIAAEVAPDLGGVDWDALEDLFGMPREEIVYNTAAPGQPVADSGMFKYQEYIEAAYKRANESLKDVRLTWQVEDNPQTAQSEILEAMNAWDAVQQDAVSVGDTVLHALRQNIEVLPVDDSLVVGRDQLRAVVSSTYMTCLYGAVVHSKGMLQLSGVAPEDIIASADSITKTLNALTKLADMGVLDPLKVEPAVQPTATEGLGAIPAAVIIAVAAVLGVGLIVWCIVEVAKQQAVNKAIEEMCTDAVRSGDPEAQKRCVELVKLNKTATNGGPLGDLAISLGQAALMIGIGYALFMLVPPVAKMLGSRKEATA